MGHYSTPDQWDRVARDLRAILLMWDGVSDYIEQGTLPPDDSVTEEREGAPLLVPPLPGPQPVPRPAMWDKEAVLWVLRAIDAYQIATTFEQKAAAAPEVHYWMGYLDGCQLGELEAWMKATGEEEI